MTCEINPDSRKDASPYYRIPKSLFTDDRYRELSLESKILYGFLLDRMSLSKKNGWRDEQGRVYIIYTVEETMQTLGCGAQKAVRLMTELETKAGLIERKRRGLGKPNLIYLKDCPDLPEPEIRNDENHSSGMMKPETPELPESKGNEPEKNKTELNQSDSFLFPPVREKKRGKGKRYDPEQRAETRQRVREQIEYDILIANDPLCRAGLDEILALIVDVLCSGAETITVSGDDKPAEVVKEQFRKLDGAYVRFVMECMKQNTTRIYNMRQYLIAALYNAPMTYDHYYGSLVSHDFRDGSVRNILAGTKGKDGKSH